MNVNKFFLLILTAASLHYCSQPAPVSLPVNFSTLQISAALGPGDVFEVKVYKEPDLSGIFQISQQGTVEYPLLGSLTVDNLTTVEISQLIRDRLKNGFLEKPFVNVFVKEFNSKKIHVLGEVKKPGTFKYEENMTIIEAITTAGGFTASARPNYTVLTRVEEGKKRRIILPVEQISKGLEKNFSIKPGDIVFVPETIL